MEAVCYTAAIVAVRIKQSRVLGMEPGRSASRVVLNLHCDQHRKLPTVA